MFQVLITPTFEKNFKKLDDPRVKDKFLRVIEILERDPYNKEGKFQIKKLRNIKPGEWRFRIGDYRLRYDIEDDKVILHFIKHRKDIYKS